MKRDVIFTFLTELIVMAIGIGVYKLAAHSLGNTGFSEYALSRRNALLLQTVVLAGLGVAIPRFLSHSAAVSTRKEADAYFAAALAILCTTATLFIFILVAAKGPASRLLFGDPGYEHLMIAMVILVAGLVTHIAAYSYFRGHLMMRKANLLQFLNMGLVPLIAFQYAKTAEGVLRATGTGYFFIASLFLVPILRHLPWRGSNLQGRGKELLRFGVERVPGDIGLAALLALPAVFIAHISDVKSAGEVAFSISLLSMVGGMFAPVGVVLLPKVSSLLATNQIPEVRRYTARIMAATLIFASVVVLLFELDAEWLMALYFGNGFSHVAHVARIVMIGSLAYTFYVGVRNILDAYYVTAVNSINIITALVFFVVAGAGSAMAGSITAILYSLIGSLVLLGLLTWARVRVIINGE